MEIHKVTKDLDLGKILKGNLGQEIFDVDFEHFGFDPKFGQDFDGLIFDPNSGKFEISSIFNSFTFVCTHKKDKKTGR